MQGTIDKYYFKSFPPIPQCNNLHSFWRHSLRHPLMEDFSGLESAREYEKPGESWAGERDKERREEREEEERLSISTLLNIN